MELELIQLLAQGGSSVVIIWMLLDMRREAREHREYMQSLLQFLIQRQWPDVSASQITKIPTIPKV